MKKLFTLATMMLMVMTGIFAQEVTTVTFTGEQQNKAYQKLDSVLVTNVTQDWSEVVYYPDTLILLSNVGITDYESRDGKVHLYQNIPNPFHGVTNFNLSLASKEKVDLVIYDISGRKVAEYHNTLPSGEHQFRASMDIPQTYLLSAVTKSGTTSIKMINLSNTGEKANIELISSLPLASGYVKKESIHGFKVGDEMQYVGYATVNGNSENDTITKAQNESEELTFTFSNEYFPPEITVTTGDATNIDFFTATVTGTFRVNHTDAKETGFEFKMSSDSAFRKFASMDLTSPFHANLKGLESNTEYIYKAYVKTTEDSLAYGEEKTFQTNKIQETKVATAEPTDITKRSATFHGSYELGNEKLMMIGFELRREEDSEFVAINSSMTIETPFQYTYEEQLKPGTKYVCRAYAVTQSAFLYGNEVSFTTLEPEPELPRVTTLKADLKTYDGTKAIIYGELVEEGFCAMKETGFYFGTTEKPQDDGQKIVMTSDTAFQFETEMLTPSTTYYYVAYATNEKGTAFGDVMSFSSRDAYALPIVGISNVKVYATSAQVFASIQKPAVEDGKRIESIFEKGICYSEKENPTVNDTKLVADNTSLSDFSATIEELKTLNTYYAKAYIITYAGTFYSEQKEITTVSLDVPKVKTISVDKVGSMSALVTSELTFNGGAGKIDVGIRVFNEDLKFDSIYPLTGRFISQDNTFKINALGLEKSTKYSVQAYAKNENGAAYGEVIEFTTVDTFVCGDLMYDIDSNQYKTVEIGTQCWMAENLRAKKLPNGQALAVYSARSTNPTLGRYYVEAKNTPKDMGTCVYYPWTTAANTITNINQNAKLQGVCPNGWHLPSPPEIVIMCSYIAPELGEAENQSTCNRLAIKLAYPDFWAPNEENDTPGYYDGKYSDAPDFNESGFSAIPFGIVNAYNSSYSPTINNTTAYFWTAFGTYTTKTSLSTCFKITSNTLKTMTASEKSVQALPVRCLRN